MFLDSIFGDVNIMTIIHVIFIIYGAYSLLTAVKMKRNNEISQWIVSANDLTRITDPAGFCRVMAPKTLAFGGACIGYGLVSVANTYFINNNYLHLFVVAAFFAFIIWYVIALQGAKRKYVG